MWSEFFLIKFVSMKGKTVVVVDVVVVNDIWNLSFGFGDVEDGRVFKNDSAT